MSPRPFTSESSKEALEIRVNGRVSRAWYIGELKLIALGKKQVTKDQMAALDKIGKAYGWNRAMKAKPQKRYDKPQPLVSPELAERLMG